YTCGPWSQGGQLSQCLNLTERFQLQYLGRSTDAFLRVLAADKNLAQADWEHDDGDPRFVDVHQVGRIPRSYVRERAAESPHDSAVGRMPEPGDPWRHRPVTGQRRPAPVDVSRYLAPEGAPKGDTSYVAVVDGEGNLFSATPSDPTFWTPMVPGLGF